MNETPSLEEPEASLEAEHTDKATVWLSLQQSG